MITIQFDVFDLSFIFFIAMSQTISVINRIGACQFLNASNPWRVCWRVRVGLYASNENDWAVILLTWYVVKLVLVSS